MKSFHRSLGTAIVLFWIPILLKAQHFENLASSFDGENIIITYDLVSNDSAARFSVSVYSSHDQFEVPLEAVKGHVGDQIAPGKGRVIIWETRYNLPYDFSGEITVKLKAATSLSPLTIQPLSRSVYKKGEDIAIQWRGGTGVDQVEIALTKKNVVKKKLVESMDNSQSYTWKIPKRVGAGKHYGVTVTKVGEATNMSEVQPFRIKARIPIWLKLSPLVVAGVVAGVLAGGDDGPDDLPEPKSWGNGN